MLKKPVDLRKLDKNFQPMVTPVEFLKVQSGNRLNPRGWKRTEEFRPFNKLVICNNCNSFMTAGLNRGRGGQYLSVGCGNAKCRAERKLNGIKPIVNSIRGTYLVELAVKIVKEGLSINEQMYRDAKRIYLEARSESINEISEMITQIKTEISKLETKSSQYSKKLIEINEKEVLDKLSKEMKYVLEDIHEKKKELRDLEIFKVDYESNMNDDFPIFSVYVNLYENYITALENTTNPELIDNLVKMLFANITVDNKNIVKYTLHEPFATYNSLKFLSGVR